MGRMHLLVFGLQLIVASHAVRPLDEGGVEQQPNPCTPETMLPYVSFTSPVDTHGGPAGNFTGVTHVHFFLRLTNDTFFRGYGWFDNGGETQKYSYGYWNQIKQLSNTDVTIPVKNLDTGSTYYIKAHVQEWTHRPGYFDFTFPEPVECLRIYSPWNQDVAKDICFKCQQDCPLPPRKGPIDAWFMLPPAHGTDLGDNTIFKMLLTYHFNYHIGLGFQGGIVYVNKYERKLIMEDPKLRPYLDNKQMVLVDWPLALHSVLRQFERYYDYSFVVNHCLLMTYECGRWLAPSVYTELLLLGQGRNMANVFEGCMGTGDIAMYSIPTKDIAIKDSKFDLPIWVSKYYTNGEDPFPEYNMISAATFPRELIANKAGSFSYFTRDGFWLHGGIRKPVTDDCAQWVNMVNMFDFKGENTTFTSWVKAK